MPPTRHSTSTAHKDSDQIPSDQNYMLGDYSFRIERSSVPGSSNDKIEAICTDKDGKNARKSIQIPSSTQLDGWYVEANETEASVYVKIKATEVDPGDVSIADSSLCTATDGSQFHTYQAPHGMLLLQGRTLFKCFATNEPGQSVLYTDERGRTENWPMNSTYTANGKTVYYYTEAVTWSKAPTISPASSGSNPNAPGIAWIMVYGDPEGETEDIIVGRFAINLEDAGGDGPGSNWDDPEDGGDPTYTLHVEVIGALSGRHNDPIVDPSYSYIPTDKDTIKQYGCGGDGGHGGGGGAGASAVVVYKFATNQAGNKEIVALARRHGYGSGGGKGGKGGDGCILVYY